MPEKLQVSGVHDKEHGIQSMDVREFLGLKVAKSIEKSGEAEQSDETGDEKAP